MWDVTYFFAIENSAAVTILNMYPTANIQEFV